MRPKACTPRTYEEICGTWITEQTAGFQKRVYSPQSAKLYRRLSDRTPAVEMKYETTDAWKDRDGNAWYRLVCTVVGGSSGGDGATYPDYLKLNKLATVLEMPYAVPSAAERRGSPAFPRTIDAQLCGASRTKAALIGIYGWLANHPRMKRRAGAILGLVPSLKRRMGGVIERHEYSRVDPTPAGLSPRANKVFQELRYAVEERLAEPLGDD